VTRGRRLRLAHTQHHNLEARQLAIPHPFSIGDIGPRLERYSSRAVHVASAQLGSGSPSGIWFRKNGADYMFYEQRTSPFHQAHIVLHLGAHALLGDTARMTFDPRLTPTVSGELVMLILGDTAPSLPDDAEADRFAFLAVQVSNHAVTRNRAQRLLRQIEPLRAALVSAVPAAARPLGETLGPAAIRKLYEAVLEVKEASLALRCYRDPEVESTTAHAGREHGLAGRDLAAVVEAAVLAHAIQWSKAGQAPCTEPCDPVRSPVSDAGLASEAAWLVQVSRAFANRSADGGSAKRRTRHIGTNRRLASRHARQER
jgi:hypothetical protein